MLFVQECSAGEVSTQARGRRVSSLGDEMYYTMDTGGGAAAVSQHRGRLGADMQHQHSLESYTLYRDKVAKIRQKQAAMPGWAQQPGEQCTTSSNTDK